MTVFAWMIERSSGSPLYWDGREMSPDPNCGIRFARKEDAERIIATHGLTVTSAVEHGWYDSPAIRQVRISVYVDEHDEPHARRYIEHILSSIRHDLTVEPVPEPPAEEPPK